EFIASTGYARKYAIRVLTLPVAPKIAPISRPRKPVYGSEVQNALQVAWAASNYIGSKRLAPFLDELVAVLERHGHLRLSGHIREQLVGISPATVDRILRPLREEDRPKGISTTKSGTLLKKRVPVRTFADWNETRPGFFEADLVAHCGWSTEGAYLNTLVLTDVATGWVECIALLHRSQHAVIEAIESARQLLPFPILGFDTDNGSEFLNGELLAYCEREGITFTRGRAYKKNDQCFVEQKNGAVVRHLIGYDRFEGQRAWLQLREIYRAIRLYVNFFQPSMKLQIKHRDGAKVQRIYDPARTPFQRVRVAFNASGTEKLDEIYKILDPVRLLEQIGTLQDALWRHAVLRNGEMTSANREMRSAPEVIFQINTGSPSARADDTDGGQRRKRKYHRTKEYRKPHDWRTRKDPFESVWGEVVQWLEINHEKTAKTVFDELMEKYSGQFISGQLRTLQRRVQTWRAETILGFDDQHLQEEKFGDDLTPPKLAVIGTSQKGGSAPLNPRSLPL
ncbi:MAG: transposase family protein, partial [Syntrophobacteraceae bacterium]